MKQDIAIYGGAFDPIHKDHVKIAETVHKTLGIPVWITPAAYHPLGKHMTDYKHRVAMVELAIKGVEGVELAQHELRNYSGLTADLSALLRVEHPDKNFRIIMGEDNAQIIKSKWVGYERIIEYHSLIIMPRVGYNPTPDWYHLPPHVVVPFAGTEVSSSMIRSLFHNHAADVAAEYLQPDVMEYIIEHNLYEN